MLEQAFGCVAKPEHLGRAPSNVTVAEAVVPSRGWGVFGAYADIYSMNLSPGKLIKHDEAVFKLDGATSANHAISKDVVT